MRYWWVNQNQTYRHEIQGGYLWSPKRNANRARNPFYKALRGDAQVRGRWGEVVLGRILQTAGLTENRDYMPQGRGMGLTSEDGAIQEPDIVVFLPESRTMIIDSKAPLDNYERLIAAEGDAARETCGKAFVCDMKAHIAGLASKKYQDNDKLVAHDYVLMFVPIESALAAALTVDPELAVHAWGAGLDSSARTTCCWR